MKIKYKVILHVNFTYIFPRYTSTFLFPCRVDFADSAHLFRWRLVLGEHDISKTEGTETIHKITEVIRHPHFTVSTLTYSNDVALLKISPQATVHTPK